MESTEQEDVQIFPTFPISGPLAKYRKNCEFLLLLI